MKPKTRPIRDLYHRFLKGTDLDGVCEPQDLSLILAEERLIVLIPSRREPLISHYVDRLPFMTKPNPDGWSTGPDREGSRAIWTEKVTSLVESLAESVEVCECGAAVEHKGEDLIDYCPDCEHIVEGSTRSVTRFEYERSQS